MELLRQQMEFYYSTIFSDRIDKNPEFQKRRETVWQAMDRFAADHLDCDPCLLKAKLHEEIADTFEPVIFPASPFFFEMGIRPAENWGNISGDSAASWMHVRRIDRCHDTPAFKNLKRYDMYTNHPIKVWAINDVFDYDHHCLNYTKLLQVGICGILNEIDERLTEARVSDRNFLEAARRSNLALIKVGRRFAKRARVMLDEDCDAQSKKFLIMIAETAGRVPEQPPETFYEGLAALLFLREAIASMENIGISVLGHIDRLLIDLYRQDLDCGRITEQEAGDLLARWMFYTDIKFHVNDNPWPETSTCIELGGCDEKGEPIFNELTRLILRTHQEHHLLNPKLNCRFGSDSPGEYLDLMSSMVLAGHNNFAFLNDDVLIPACLKSGKTVEEARLYVNGGCQETMVEGVEHSAGAYYYFNMASVLNLCLLPIREESCKDIFDGAVAGIPVLIEKAKNFEEYYRQFLENMRDTIALGAGWLLESSVRWSEVHPCPLFSSGLEGCIEQARDYTQGGAKYNPAGISLVGFGTVVDSLYVIHQAVFEKKWLSLTQLQSALANSWKKDEDMRIRLIKLPKFGEGNPDVDRLAEKFCRDLAAELKSIRNERNGYYQPSMFVYYAFQWMGQQTRATPDGRKNGEMLSQGCSPSRVRGISCLPDIFRSLSQIDFTDFPGNAVLDLQLPLGGEMRPEILSAVLRTFVRLGGMTLQINSVSSEELMDAKVHPEMHQDLVIRISGLSAKFVALTSEVQDEIIDRTLIQV